MNIATTFTKAIPSSLAPLAVWLSPPASGVLISLTSKSGSAMTYKFQESSDGGGTWADKSFFITCDTEASSFSLPAGATHNAKVTGTGQLRLMALGVDGEVILHVTTSLSDDPDEPVTFYPIPS